MPPCSAVPAQCVSTTDNPNYALMRNIGANMLQVMHGYHPAPVCDSRSHNRALSRSPEPLEASQLPFRSPSGRRTRFSHGRRQAKGYVGLQKVFCF